ncbi:Ldh family oxidoreductase [Pantoea sp. Ap-967]|uniref:Ldh family oxidoreductase n=1 Tax=Pantoea sp. Ap-967 TaxID=2608362 RepID=UPI0014207DEA|nr:Ldh family oxidoreductase [Pantoea sp. Ap-967]NIE73307.1 Ldh family oxidoreductase [Pantoea sp. Ap-967]
MHNDKNVHHRYLASDVEQFAKALFTHYGADEEKAAALANVLLEGELLGHRTHGLALLEPYLREIESGSMTLQGEPAVIADKGAVSTWDGRRLPGPWLMKRALGQCIERAREYGTATLAIRRSHHIACLAAYLKEATDQGFILEIQASGPSSASVAPFGGRQGVLSPNPIAIGFPTRDSAVLIDVSTSVTSNSYVNRCQQQGRELPWPWLLDAAGQPSKDPAAIGQGGTILPLGGMDAGHKGYGLSLMIEALTTGLGGHGRADPAEGFGASSVLLQVYDPQAFAGTEAFLRQTQWLQESCKACPPVHEQQPVRLPGERGLIQRETQLREGLLLEFSVIASWPARAAAARIALPEPLR